MMPQFYEHATASLAFLRPLSSTNLISAPLGAEVEAAEGQRVAVTKLLEDSTARFRAQEETFSQLQAVAQTQLDDLLNRSTTIFETAQARFADEQRALLSALETSRSESEEKSRALEATFREKLRLEEPAKYWTELEKMYVKQGRRWIIGTVVLALLLAIGAGFVLYNTPAILSSDKFTLNGFKGAVLIAAAASGFLYLISVFVRVATSSYHLARDARERLQLTHVFLALIKDTATKDNAIDGKTREIILTALFSRSDTGLLKGDSGPTLPTPLGSLLEVLKGKS